MVEDLDSTEDRGLMLPAAPEQYWVFVTLRILTLLSSVPTGFTASSPDSG